MAGQVWVWFIGAYLLGSISCAILVCRCWGLPDPRTVGSGNPGATNVLRAASKGVAAIVLLGDALKGFIPVAFAQYYYDDPLLISLTLMGAVLGHVYPVFFRFVGGKGIATMIGGLFALHWPLGLLFIGIWLLVAGVLRYSSLASMLSTLAMPLAAFWLLDPLYAVPLSLLTLLLLWRHRDNIRRLCAGKEGKINLKR